MKRFLLFWIFISMVLAVFAQGQTIGNGTNGQAQREPSTHVTAAEAMDVGYAFMHTGSGSKRGGTQSGAVRKQSMQLVYTGRATDSLTRATTDCYYVFALQPIGFVIVAADERVNPILGYSYDNDFVVENMPDHVRGWLGGYERQIKTAIDRDMEPVAETATKWSRLKSGQPMSNTRNGNSVGPLLTTTWNQGQYYNNLCPADANGPAGHVYTGCVATAMSQIINYHQYPQHGRGTHSYESNYGTLTVNYGSANYDYTNMPDALTYASNAMEVDAVATLMRDCGVAVNMGYAADESGALDPEARAALINFFKYSPNMSYAEKAYFTNDEWETLLRNDLDAGNPVYYSGQGTGGHAFVCDGYNADGYFSFNFGWGGYCNGWYLTSNVNPGGSTFNDSQSAIFGIVPDSTGNVILGQMAGTSTFMVDEPLKFYHLMGHNAYEGGYYGNSGDNTVNFVPANSTNQIVADILDYEDQGLIFFDGNNGWLREFYSGGSNDLSPVVSSRNALQVAYFGNLYYAGFILNISQTNPNECRMVSNIISHVDTTIVHLTWTENGGATQWEIEYGIKGFELGTGTLHTATTNTITINNLQKLTEYDFYIRSVCGTGLYGSLNKVTIMVEAEYWQEIVTSQPVGYVYNAQTNSVEVSTAEGLAWCAKNNASGISIIKLTADIDLSGYKWRPFELNNTKFDGQGHIISNAYIHESSGDVGLFSTCTGGRIGNLGLTNSQIKGAGGTTGGICGSYSGDIMRNCYISSSIVDGGNGGTVGGLIGSGTVVNCYANAHVIGNHWIGLLVGSGSAKNCYAAGSMRVLSYCNQGGIAAVSGEVSNCYSVWTLGGVVGQGGPVADISTFVKSSSGCTLLTPIDFDGAIETDLLSALNRGLVLCNDSLCLTWTADTGNVNGGYPVFGSSHYLVQCQDVSDFSVEQVVVNNNYAVKVSWTENGDATQWRIRYRPQDRPDTAYTFVITANNPDTLYGIPLGPMYDFNIHAICGTNARSAWSMTQSLFVDIPFWTDIVTTQPAGYVEDAEGNVEIYSAEGLAWLSVITHGFHNQQQSSFEGKTVTLKTDINLNGYRWYPTGVFSGTFDGQNHSVSNIYMNRASGLIGLLHGIVKNVNLVGGTVINGSGGLIGTAIDCQEISNCHTSVTVHGGNGALCGEIWNNDGSSKINISNCSSMGTVNGGNSCGSLIGYIYDDVGGVEIRNCYATGNAYGERYVGGLIGYLRGAKVYNCFSTGHVEFSPSYSLWSGSVIGCSDLGAGCAYIYGQDNVNAGVALIGCGNFPCTTLFHHEGNTNILLSPVSINGETPANLLDALNAWVAFQNDPTLRTWVLDTLTGYPVFGDYYVASCYNPADLIVSQATVVGDVTIKTRFSWTQESEPDHWEILYVAAGQPISSGDFGTIIPVSSNPCVLAGIPVGQPLDFYVRTVCSDGNTSGWCGPVTYIPDKLHWTEVVTSQPEGFQDDGNGNVYISSAEGLSWISSIVNELNDAPYIDFNQIILTKDIDLSAYRWASIGYDWWHHLNASFNGNNHVVTGLYCNELDGYQGLFGHLYGNVNNLTLSQCNVIGTEYVGAIAGYSFGNKIVNCMVNGNVWGYQEVGGLVGIHHCFDLDIKTIENSCFIGNVTVEGGYAGGITGVTYSDTTVNCYVVSDFVDIGYRYTGVITGTGGWNSVINCYYKENNANLSITYDNEANEANNSSFSGIGSMWTLNTPPYINGAFHTDLVDALNAWVDANNTNGQYNRWVADTNMVNGGYPVFESVSLPAVTAQDTVVAQGYYSWRGMVFTSDTVMTDTLYTLNGYDSVVTYHIFVNPIPITEITVDTCSSYTWNREIYHETGDYVQSFTAVNNSDSVVILHLTINRLTSVDEQRVCGNSGFKWIDGVTYIKPNNTATYTLQTADGCDSVVTLHLIFQNSTGDTTVFVCDSFDWYEHAGLATSGDYTHTFTNSAGCDSVVTLHLIVNHANTGDTIASACDSFDWYEHTGITQSCENLTHTFTNAAGCDSVVTLHLTINKTSYGDTTAIACDSYDWYEHTGITQSCENLTHTFTNAVGCDSVVTLHLTINKTSYGDTIAIVCDSFDWYEHTGITQPCENLTHTFTNAVGCDSVVTLHLTINKTSYGDTTAIACNSFDWYEHTDITQSCENLTHTFTNAAGCDSVVTLHLTVNKTSYGDTTAIAYNSFDWYEYTGITQSCDNLTHTFINAAGCDSIVTLHLTINTLYWTDVVTSQPEGYQEDENGNVYISSAEGLSWLSSVVNELNGAQNRRFNHVVLTHDIDLSAYRWKVIGINFHGFECVSFNGNNHIVSGLNCQESDFWVGLFGDIVEGEIHNLILTQCEIHCLWNPYNYQSAGAIAARVYGTRIFNCMVNGNVSGGYCLGGLAGENYDNNIENSCFIGTVSSGIDQSGGICGNLYGGGVFNCYAVNEITVEGMITGTCFNPDFVSNCYYKDNGANTPITSSNCAISNNSGFTGGGYTWTLSTPPYINGTYHTDLVDALNAWVDANNTDGRYCHWVADTAMVNGGYPVFEAMSYPVVHDTVIAHESYSWHDMVFTSDTVLADTILTSTGYFNVLMHHLVVYHPVHTALTVDTCDGYSWGGTSYNTSGDYTYSHLDANGCTQVDTLHLTVRYSTTGDTTAIVCDSFDWYEHTGITQSCENLTHTFTNETGCDSLVTLHLTVNHSTHNIETMDACESYVWHGETHITSGIYTFSYINTVGCASTDTLHLTVNYSNIGDTTATACDSFDWYEHTGITQSCDNLTHTFTNTAGCDSIVTLHLTINHTTYGDTTAIVCDSFDWYEYTGLTQSCENLTHTFTNATGCDSVVTLHLTINNPVHAAVTETACESFAWNGTVYTVSGDYTYSHEDAYGCMQVDTLHLTINQGTHNVTTEVACESYEWHNSTYSTSGTYTYEYFNENDCASVDTLHLTINHTTTGDTTATSCESFTWEGATFTESGDYMAYKTNAVGCDSIVTLHLTVNPSFSIEAYLTISENDLPFTYGDTTFMPGTVQSGDYIFNFTTADGCDSVIILHLTVETGINDYALNVSMKVYPNPTKDLVNVQLTMNNEQLEGVNIQVFDVYGRLLEVINMADARGASLQTAQIDLSRYANGVYLIKAVAEGNVLAVRKVVKK